jgi:hypothetical protein
MEASNFTASKRRFAMPTFETERSGPSRSLRRAAAGLALAALASLALIAAGCGSDSGGPKVAQVSTSSTTTQPSESGDEDGSGDGNRAAFSACMRSHGVPKFPDPQPDGSLLLRAGPGTGLDPESPQFKAAGRACRKFQPPERKPSPAEQAKDRAQMLKFSACMRSHGLPKFPDPSFSADGGIQLRINRNSGLDPRSPQFKAAQKACQDLMPGRPGSAEAQS